MSTKSGEGDILPGDLRTSHFLCDIHHSLLIVTARRMLHAAGEGKGRLVDYFADIFTLYWALHCVMEEEDFCLAARKGILAPGLAERHASAHAAIMEGWGEQVFIPLKTGRLQVAQACGPIDTLYSRVLAHIEHEDQGTYGSCSAYSEGDRLSANAHIKGTGLPLSPYMAGAMEVLRGVAPDLARLVSPASLGTEAARPLGALRLTQADPGSSGHGTAAPGMRAHLMRGAAVPA